MHSRQYVAPDEFHKEYRMSIEKGEPTRKLLLMFEKIAKNNSLKVYSRCKLDVDSCVNYALTEAWLKWDKFDYSRSGNIFSFFTKMIKNDIFQHYRTINKHKHLFISIDLLFSKIDN